MSATYVYALIDFRGPSARPGGSRLPPSFHVDGHRIDLIEVGGVWAAIEEIDEPPELSEQSLRSQHRVAVVLAHRFDATLPARFGAVVDRLELARIVTARRQRIQRAFEAVRGRAQMTLRVFGPGPMADRRSVRPPRTGTDYLQGRREAARARLPVAGAAIRRAVRPLVQRERVEAGRGLVQTTVHHLIQRSRAAEYKSLVRRALAKQQSTGQIVVSGPWPPFAFVPALLP